MIILFKVVTSKSSRVPLQPTLMNVKITNIINLTPLF